MLNNDIRDFLEKLNFLEIHTDIPRVTIMKNVYQHSGEILYFVLVDNEGRQFITSGTMSAIYTQLSGLHIYPDPPPRILFLVVSNQPERDKNLTRIVGPVVWIADSVKNELIVEPGQEDDFFGLRYGLEETIKNKSEKDAWKDPKKLPYVTIALIAVNVIWFIVLTCLGDVENADFLWKMGGDYGPSVFQDLEFYRLLISMFMHTGFLHLFGNMIYLAIGGYITERKAGHLRFFLIYILSGLASGLISCAVNFLTDQNTVSVGASGAIYGIVGLVIFFTSQTKGQISRKQMGIRILLILFFLAYSNFAVEGVDSVAHIAGFIFGLLLSFAFLYQSKNQPKPKKEK